MLRKTCFCIRFERYSILWFYHTLVQLFLRCVSHTLSHLLRFSWILFCCAFESVNEIGRSLLCSNITCKSHFVRISCLSIRWQVKEAACKRFSAALQTEWFAENAFDEQLYGVSLWYENVCYSLGALCYSVSMLL